MWSGAAALRGDACFKWDGRGLRVLGALFKAVGVAYGRLSTTWSYLGRGLHKRAWPNVQVCAVRSCGDALGACFKWDGRGLRVLGALFKAVGVAYGCLSTTWSYLGRGLNTRAWPNVQVCAVRSCGDALGASFKWDGRGLRVLGAWFNEVGVACAFWARGLNVWLWPTG